MIELAGWIMALATIIICYRVVDSVRAGEAFTHAERAAESALAVFRTFPPKDAAIMAAEMMRAQCRTPLERRMAILALADLYWRILDGADQRGIQAPKGCRGWRDRLDLAFAYLGSDDPKAQRMAGPVVVSIADEATFAALTRAMRHTVEASQRWGMP